MLVIVFRSKLTAQAGQDYAAMNDNLEERVKENPGYIDAKSYVAEDGERLTLVWWKDEASLKAWRELPTHRAAQQTGRERWYEFYKIDVANVIRSNAFDKSAR